MTMQEKAHTEESVLYCFKRARDYAFQMALDETGNTIDPEKILKEEFKISKHWNMLEYEIIYVTGDKKLRAWSIDGVYFSDDQQFDMRLRELDINTLMPKRSKSKPKKKVT